MVEFNPTLGNRCPTLLVQDVCEKLQFYTLHFLTLLSCQGKEALLRTKTEVNSNIRVNLHKKINLSRCLSFKLSVTIIC